MLRKAVLIVAVVASCGGKALSAPPHDLISVISNATGGMFDSVKQTIASNLHNYTFAAVVVPGAVRNVTHILGYDIPPSEKPAFPPPPQKPTPLGIFNRMAAGPVFCETVPDDVDSLAEKLNRLKPDEVSKLVRKLDGMKDRRIVEKVRNRTIESSTNRSGILDRMGAPMGTVTPASYFETTALNVSEVPVTTAGFFETTALNRSVETVTHGGFFETTALHDAEGPSTHLNFFETTELSAAEHGATVEATPNQFTPPNPVETTTATPTKATPPKPSKLTVETTTTKPTKSTPLTVETTTIPTQSTTIQTMRTPSVPNPTTQKNLLNEVVKELVQASLNITTTEAAPKSTKKSKRHHKNRPKEEDDLENPFGFDFDGLLAEMDKKVKEDAERLKLDDDDDDKTFHFG